MKIKTLLISFAIISAVGIVNNAKANDQCGKNIVIVDKKVGADFTSFALRFKDQHTAEEFADQVNAAPIVENKSQRFTVRQKATVYAK